MSDTCTNFVNMQIHRLQWSARCVQNSHFSKISFSAPSTYSKGQYRTRNSYNDRHLPAINCQYLPRHIGACPTCEKHSRAFEVIRTAPSARWDAVQDARSSRFVIYQSLVHVCLNITWCDLRFELAMIVPKQ